MDISQIKKYKKFVEGGDYQDSSLEKMSERYSQQMEEGISHLDILINSTRANTIYKNDVAYKCIVDYGRLPKKSSNIKEFAREVWTKHSDGIGAGDVVQFAHIPYADTERKKYMFLECIETRDGYDMSIMKPCLSTLKWLNKDGIVQEADFTYRAQAATNFGVTDDRVLTLGNERRQLIIPSNVETLKIKKDRRFIFDERCWKVTALDKLDIGVIYLTLEENEINPATDRVDLRIADYVGKVANYSITILGGNNISIQAGKTLQLETEVTNNGTIVTNKSVSYSSSNPSIATVNSNGLLSSIANGSVIITASLIDYPTITDTQNITVQFSTGANLTVEIHGNDTINKGYSQHYTIEVKNNGVVDNTQHVQWYLYADDGASSTPLAQLDNAQFTQCDLKGLGLGYVKLKCIVTGYASVSAIKRINIKSII